MTVAHDDLTETDVRRDTVTVDGTDTVADAADTDQHEAPSRARSARARHIALKSHRALLESLLALPPTRTIDLADTERRTA